MSNSSGSDAGAVGDAVEPHATQRKSRTSKAIGLAITRFRVRSDDASRAGGSFYFVVTNCSTMENTNQG